MKFILDVEEVGNILILIITMYLQILFVLEKFTAGYAPLSAVITKNIYQKIIKENIGEFYHAHTFQGYAVGLADLWINEIYK